MPAEGSSTQSVRFSPAALAASQARRGGVANCWSSICAPEAVHAHRAAGTWPARKDRYGNWFREWLQLGERVSSQQVADARIAYDRCTGQLNGLFSSDEGSVDVLMCPAMPSPPDTGACLPLRDAKQLLLWQSKFLDMA